MMSKHQPSPKSQPASQGRILVVVADAIKQRLQKFGVPHAKLDIFNSPPPPQKNSLPHPNLKALAKSAQESTKYILAVGRLHWEKGFDLLLQTYAGLAGNAPPLVILGEAGDVAGLTKAISKVLGDEKLCQRLAVAGRKRAGEFAIGEIAPLWLKA